MSSYLCLGLMSPYLINEPDYPSDILLMGGTAFGALEGVRLFTESCVPVAYVGEDFDDIYEEWMLRHSIAKTFLVPRDLPCPRIRQQTADHGFSSRDRKNLPSFAPDLPLISSATGFDTKGISISLSAQDPAFWLELYDQKSRYGFKLVWQYCPDETMSANEQENVRRILSYCDLWSVNMEQASRLFGMPKGDCQEIAEHIMNMPAPLTLLRNGEHGSYVITSSDIVFCEAVRLCETLDNRGCGSVSTGAALYALCEGYAPAMVGIFANTAAGYHASQSGPVDPVSSHIMREILDRISEQYVSMSLTRRKKAEKT